MPATITILDGSGDGDDTDLSTTSFAGSPSGTTGTVLATDVTPIMIFESELEGIAAATNISVAATTSITINDLTDNNLNLAQIAGNSVTFTASIFTMAGADDTITTAGGALNVTTSGGATIGGLNTNGGLITLSVDGASAVNGVIAGVGTALTKSGTGTLTLSAANTYTGATNINAGTLTASNGAAIPDASAVTALSGATFNLANSETIGSLAGDGSVTLGANALTTGGNNGTTTFSGSITGNAASALNKDGAGEFTLSGDNSAFDGAININAGLLVAANANALGSTTGATTVANGAALWINNVAIVGELVNLGGVLRSSGTASLSGAILLTTNNVAVTVVDGSLTLSGVIDDGASSFGLSKLSSGTLTLSGANTYDGITQVATGTLIAANNSALGSTGGVTTVMSGATLNIANGIIVAEAITVNGAGVGVDGALTGTGIAEASGAITLGTGATVGATAASTLTLSGIVGGTDLAKAGPGTVVLSNTGNNYTGATTITAGTLRLGASNVLPDTTALTVNGATATLDIVGNSDIVASVSLQGGGTITGTTGVLTSIAAFDMQSGTVSAILAGAAGLTKTTAGTVTLSGANTYTGATSINGGTLLVNDSIASATTSVNATGTLGGSGTVQAVHVASGGTIAPGASAGILHTGNLMFAAGANFSAELGGTIAGIDYDQLSATGTVNIGGATLTGSLLGSPVVGTSYTIIATTAGVSGTFAGLADGATTYIGNRAFQIDYTATNVDLTLGALKISGTDPVNVLADVNTTTIAGLNVTSPTQSVVRDQIFSADITGTVNAGITIDGFGLSVTSLKSGGAIDFTNDGAILVNAAAANHDDALVLIGNGGGVHYSGTGTISNDAANTPDSDGLFIASTGGIGGNNLIEVAGTITGNVGVKTSDGTTSVVVSGAVTGTGGPAIQFSVASSNNVVDLKPTAVINGNLIGSGNDDGVRLSGTSGSGSFDLSKIAGGFSTLTKVDGSTWTVTGTFADPDAATIIVNGALLVNGTISGGVTVATSFTETLAVPLPVLGGIGTVGDVLVRDKGTLAPGTSAGTLTVTGNLTMSVGSILSIEIGGAGAGQFDVLDVNGTAPDTGLVELGAATLTGSLIGGFTASVGQVFKIIDNAGADAIASPFSGISEGGTVNFGGQTFAVSYVGGDGNDVTLTAVAAFGTPALSGFGPSANVTQAGPAATPQVLDGAVEFTDAEGNFNGGTLIVSGLLAEDIVSVPSTGTDPGQFLILENGAVDRLFFEGVEIGGISGGEGTTLNITFNGAATTSAIDALIENLTFLDLSANPTFERTLSLNVTDAAATSTGALPLLVRVFNGDIQFGTPGDDSFTPAGDAHIDAGGGIDTITFDFRLVDATVTYSGNQVIIDAPSQHLVLSGFEIFNFTDGTVNNNDGDVLVDDLFYYSKYHDIWNAHADADAHYHSVGWHEGRDPDAFFSTVIYLSANPDVKAAGVDPLFHFDQSGWKEGRVPSIDFDPAAYLAANPDVAAAHIDPLAHFLQFGAGEGRQPFAPTELIGATGFDYVFYLQNNPDVAAAGVDPLVHFQQFGWKEGRDPNALFDTNGYLANYADVAAAHVNPLDHYNQFGWHEGRDPSVNFDTTSYLSAYADVNAANVNPLTHFLHYGIHEGRSAFADGVWG